MAIILGIEISRINSMDKKTEQEMFELKRTILKRGNVVQIYYGKGNLNNQRIHIRGYVDRIICIYKSWRKRKRYWSYYAEDLYYFWLRRDIMRLIKKG